MEGTPKSRCRSTTARSHASPFCKRARDWRRKHREEAGRSPRAHLTPTFAAPVAVTITISALAVPIPVAATASVAVVAVAVTVAVAVAIAVPIVVAVAVAVTVTVGRFRLARRRYVRHTSERAEQ